MTTPLYEEALALVLQLPLKERIQLIEQVKASLEHEIKVDPAADGQAHWGKSLNQILDEIGPIEFVDPHIEDPVEWVKAQRQKRADKLKHYREGDL